MFELSSSFSDQCTSGLGNQAVGSVDSEFRKALFFQSSTCVASQSNTVAYLKESA